MEDHAALLDKLKSKYCPPVDPATFLAIVSDFDLSNEDDFEIACATLNSISASAETEDSTGFDPSGTTGLAPTGNEPNQSTSSERNSPSETNYTSLSESVRALNLEGLDDETATQDTDAFDREAQTVEHISRLQLLDVDAQEETLAEAFPGLKPFDINWTLKKHNGDVQLAVEDLLNQTFLEETGGRHRGVEGFSEGGGAATAGFKRKKRSRNNRRLVASESNEPSSEQSLPIPSAWETKRKDLDLIKRLCGMSNSKAGALYEKCKRSVPAALESVLIEYAEVPMDRSHEAMEELAALTRSFPGIAAERLGTIIMICENAESSPAEFCNSLLQRKETSEPSTVTLKLDYKLKPKDAEEWTEASSKRTTAPQRSTPSLSYADAGQGFRSLRNENFDKAGAAYRKARSDPMMGHAAAYYAEEGRDYNAKAKSASAAAADHLVAQQSSSKQLDLHGIGVNDAVRIAREAVTAWWVTVDQSGSHAGYTIVTGKGTHSEDGVARIRNAVGRMLIREGWKADIGTGSILVRGTTGIKRAYK